ncbi:MAG: putative glutamine amidotransferase [Arenicella sp.]|jgi:predicted glutamine amidotransferase
MCQLLGLSSSDPVRLSFSWESFVMRGSQARGNPDGWGVAYFEGRDAMLLREPTPAAESPMVEFLTGHAPRSNLVISHVRRATHGERNLANTQPFQRVFGAHTHIFAHNGFVPPFKLSNTSSFFSPQGTTDSERLFCYLLSQLEPLWSGAGVPALEKRFEVVKHFAQEILERGASNFLYSDGVTLFAHGHRRTIPGDEVSDEPGLYVNMIQSKQGSDMAISCQGLRTEGACSNQALVSTLPLSDDEWVPLKAGEIACFQDGLRIK